MECFWLCLYIVTPTNFFKSIGAEEGKKWKKLANLILHEDETKFRQSLISKDINF